MPKVTINGKELDAPEGINVIRAADMLGMEIPHYCYHPALTVPGNCRMCLVEIEKAPKLQIACNTRVTEGMVVHTNSDKAKAAQRAVLEFLLVNHPVDCPVCDQAGECKLQDYYMDYDRQESRFPLPEKVRKGKAKDIGSDVMLDQERCVLCGRCTRFLDEVTQTSELAFFERGDHNRIDIYPGRKLDNKYAGNIIDICPVGALTEKDFRFRMRVWYLHRTPSVCGGCERGCSIDIHENHGKIFRYKPRHNPLVNGYWMCDEGRHSFEKLQTERRITKALHQSGDHLVPESFAAGIRRAADAIRKCGETHGAGAIGALIGAQATNEEIFALKSFMTDVIGSDVIGGMSYTPPGSSGDDHLLIRANKNPNTRGLVALGVPLDGLDQLAEAVASGRLKMLIALRADAFHALGEAEFVKRFGALEYFLVLDTDVGETAQMANQVIPIAAYPELEGTFTNFEGVVQQLHRAFDPPGEAKPAIEALTDLALVLDGVERPQSAPRIFAEIAAREAPFAGLQWNQLGHDGAKLAGA